MKEAGQAAADHGRLDGDGNIGFEVAMRERGISVIKTKVGDRYVLEQMQTSGAVLGGEQSGHIIFLEHNTTGDGSRDRAAARARDARDRQAGERASGR